MCVIFKTATDPAENTKKNKQTATGRIGKKPMARAFLFTGEKGAGEKKTTRRKQKRGSGKLEDSRVNGFLTF